MNVDTILRPHELHFHVPPQLAKDINNLIAALERDDDLNLDCYLNEVEGSAREVSEEHDDWLRNYYCYWGWMKYDKNSGEFHHRRE